MNHDEEDMEDESCPAPAQQLGLFAPEEQARWESHLLELVQGNTSDRARFSGRTVERDVELVQSVVVGIAGGIGVKRLAAMHRVSPQTVRGIRDRAEAAGKIGPWKARLASKLQRFAEDAVDVMLDDVASGKMKGSQLSVPVAIAIDKIAALQGEPSLVIEHRHELSIEGLRRQFEELRQGAVEVQSVGNGAFPQQKAIPGGVGAGVGADLEQEEHDQVAALGELAEVGAAASTAGPGPEGTGGGGSFGARGATEDMGSRRQNFIQSVPERLTPEVSHD